MRTRVVPAVALAALAVLARLPGVWRLALSEDEVASARILRQPTLLSAVHRVVRTESTPPLWYALGWAAHHAGLPIVDVRLLSVIFGGCLTAATFLLASSLVEPPYAATAALLVALGYGPVFHGSELRAYELLAMLTALLALVLIRALRRARPALDVALVTVVWAGFLTHYFFVFPALACTAWLWLEPQARPLRRRATLAIAAGAGLATPWLPAFLVQYRQDRFWWIGRFEARAIVVTPLRIFAPYGTRHLLLGAAVATTVAAGSVLLARRSAEGRLVTALVLGPVGFAAALWAAGVRIYAVRNLIEIAPFVAIAAVAALARVPQPARAVAVLATVAAAAIVWTAQTTLPAPAYQAIAQRLVAEGWRPADPIAVFGNFFQFRAPLEWYLPHAPRLDVSRPDGRICQALFVIVDHRGAFSVTRVRNARIRRLRALRRATLLASMVDTPACVRLSRNPRLEPIA